MSKVHFGHLNNQYTNVGIYCMKRNTGTIHSTLAFLILQIIFFKHLDHTEIITTCKMLCTTAFSNIIDLEGGSFKLTLI